MRIVLVVTLLLWPGLASAQPFSDAPSISYIQEALEEGNEELILQLCTDGNTIQSQRFGRKKQTAVHVAASAYQMDILAILINQCKLDPSELDNSKTPPLYYARMSPSTVGALLELGADPNQMVKHFNLPIISQFLINEVPRKSLDQFILHNVDLSQKSVDGRTPLMYSVMTKRMKSVEFLLDARQQGFDVASDEVVLNGKKLTDFTSPEIAALLAEHGIE